jgi:flagellar protein FliO/FliZ
MSLRAAALWMLAHAACAADPAPPAAATGPGSFFSLLQVVLALLLVLGAIMAFAWFARRIGPGRGAAGGLLKVVGGVMVGPKERLVVVEVGDTWLIVGVGASSVNLVHSMPRPATVNARAESSFASLIGQARKARTPEG